MNALDKFIVHMRKYSFRLLHKNDKGELTGFATCFIFQNKKSEVPIIITAGHKLSLSGALIETNYADKDGKPLLLDAGEFKIFFSDDIDFAYSKLPLKVIKYLQNNKSVQIGCYIEEIEKPSLTEDYGFSMMNNHEFMSNNETLQLPRYACYEVAMKFTLEDRGFYYFKTLNGLKEDDDYAGASGSPIADREGKIVSILTGRSDDRRYLKGACLDKLIEKINESHLNN